MVWANLSASALLPQLLNSARWLTMLFRCSILFPIQISIRSRRVAQNSQCGGGGGGGASLVPVALMLLTALGSPDGRIVRECTQKLWPAQGLHTFIGPSAAAARELKAEWSVVGAASWEKQQQQHDSKCGCRVPNETNHIVRQQQQKDQKIV